MSEIDDGGPAFPTDSESQVGERVWHFSGITKREWFAGMALQGALSRGVEGVEVERIASDSFLMADAMVQAGKGEKNGE